MSVLVDSSVWIDYFRGGETAASVEGLIDDGLIVVNDLILAEIAPALIVKRQRQIVALLQEIPRAPLDIEWNGIVDLQVNCLRNGINKVGIPDLVIVQNTLQNSLSLLSLDKHFRLIGGFTALDLY